MSTENLDGRFTVKGPLRCAGVGSLMCAEDKDGSRTAIRVIPQVARGVEAIAAALRMPQHPVLPRTLGSGAMNDSSWVAIDFPEGELLTHRIPLNTPALLTMGSMIAGALAALHQNDIIHGELSSESVLAVPAAGGDRFVLFDAPLVVMNRLTDRRGEERLLSQLTHLVPFLAPERARGADATRAADVWSLGMIISLASGAQGIPGSSTLEKIAAIVTNKWRPAVSSTLPIALRLLLTRMLAPDARDRPSALDVTSELEHLCVALGAHQNVKPHAPPAVDTQPIPPARIEKLVEESKAVPSDPFETLVAQGVTSNDLDSHAEPTRRMVIPLTAEMSPGHDVTDPHAVMPPPTAPNGPIWNQPAKAEEGAAPADLTPMALLIPVHPSQQRRTPMPLPPILDPLSVVVAPQAVPRHPSPAPLPKMLPVADIAFAPTQVTARFGALPGAVRPEKVPATLVTEDVAAEAAAARAEVAAEAVAPAPVVVAPASIHDAAEDAFAAHVQRAQKRRYMFAAIAASVVIVVAGGLLIKSSFDSEPAPVKAEAPAPALVHAPVKKVAAVLKPEPAPKVEEVAAAPAPVAKAEPAPKPEPVAKAEPVARAEPVAKAEPKPAPVKAAPAAKVANTDLKRPEELKPAPAARPAKQAKKTEEAPRRPASRLADDD